MNITLPTCPKCGQPATAPTRLGMSALPYQCPNCGANFNLVIVGSDLSRLRDAYADSSGDELLLDKCKIVFQRP